MVSVLGTVFVVWASLGNSINRTNPLWIVFGMGSVAVFIFLPYYTDANAAVINTHKSGDAQNQVLYHLSLVCGFILIANSLLNIAQRMCSEKAISSQIARRFLTPGVVVLESKTKQAASYKINALARNAHNVHKVAEHLSSGTGETKYGKALLAYAKCFDQTEEVEGLCKTWKRVASGALFREDGIWLVSMSNVPTAQSLRSRAFLTLSIPASAPDYSSPLW